MIRVGDHDVGALAERDGEALFAICGVAYDDHDVGRLGEEGVDDLMVRKVVIHHDNGQVRHQPASCTDKLP